MNSNFFQTSIEYLKGVGPSRAKLLKKELGIFTFQDLANLFPNRYLDRTQFYKISQLEKNNAEVQIIGKLTQIKTVSQKNKKRLIAKFEDDSGSIELVWFKGHKWIKENLKTYEKKLRPVMQPVYPSTELLSSRGISNRVMFGIMENLFFESKDYIFETLPKDVLESYHLLSKKEALINIHFPQNQHLLTRAQYRLKFEEFFYIQIQLIRKNLLHKAKIKGYPFSKIGDNFNLFYKEFLPFKLTVAQKRVIKEIRNDLGSFAQMNRLLQGDVGSGKTIVALMSILIAIDNGFQACLMAPTEILSVQHYNGLVSLCKKLNISIFILTGSSKTSDRKIIHKKLENGKIDLLIGTHALLEDKVKFKNLGLAIIDEQHRFGVAQRSKLWRKNNLPPHILVMTATPIPRTLAMSVYGNLDISIIDELPPGRKQIKTVHRFDANRLRVFKFIKDEIFKGRQVYIVYPLIQESEALDYKDLMDGFESISREFKKPTYQISIVHGKMKAKDKEFEMNRFLKGETQIMIATTVIEVGVNVPNASVMIIESAERFGLSQLHQLRGRVGRGADQSYCVLMTSHKLSENAKTRIETMVKTSDGFEIAEVDLKLRGPGDLMGTQQSGILNLRIADIVKDHEILKFARSTASEILKKDPSLTLPKNKPIKMTYIQLKKYKNIWNYIS